MGDYLKWEANLSGKFTFMGNYTLSGKLPLGGKLNWMAILPKLETTLSEKLTWGGNAPLSMLWQFTFFKTFFKYYNLYFDIDNLLTLFDFNFIFTFHLKLMLE